MPGGDRTGPMGRGPMTGWSRGICGGSEAQQFERGGFGGRGRGFGHGGGGGGGWGWRNQFRATGVPGWMRVGSVPPAFASAEPVADTELQWLERRSAVIEAEQEQIKARLSGLKAERDD